MSGKHDFRDRAVRIPISRILRWAVLDWFRGGRRWPERIPAPRRADAAEAFRRIDGPAIAWCGHASSLVRLNGRHFLTDPCWHRALVVPRLGPAAPPLDELPPLDAVAISHAHYDHLSMPTLRELAKRNPDAVGLVPLGLAGHLRRAGFRRVVELDWWESTKVGEIEATLVPARHWSRRGLFDLNRTLWGGWVFAGERRVWFAGDTAFDRELFRSIGERCGPLDAALLPIGAYSPEWFMCHQHLRPEDAGEALLESGARLLVAIHWGTFVLSDEATLEPPERLRSWWRQEAPERKTLWIPEVGGSIALGPDPERSLPLREGPR